MSYDWSRFTVHSYYRAPLSRVSAAWSTAAGLESFFLAWARHTSADGTERAADERVLPGDRYAWHFVHGFDLEGEFLPVVPPTDVKVFAEAVACSFGPMQVQVHMAEVDGQVEVRLEQSGCGEGDDDRASQHLNSTMR